LIADSSIACSIAEICSSLKSRAKPVSTTSILIDGYSERTTTSACPHGRIHVGPTGCGRTQAEIAKAL
jgi:hypothetical protein